MPNIWKILAFSSVIVTLGYSNAAPAQNPPSIITTSSSCFDGCNGQASSCYSDSSCCGELSCLSNNLCGTLSDFGGGCRGDIDCVGDLVCNDDQCGPIGCVSNDACPGDQVCSNGECEDPDTDCSSCDTFCNTYDPQDCGYTCSRSCSTSQKALQTERGSASHRGPVLATHGPENALQNMLPTR
jgi:hypothetical protein